MGKRELVALLNLSSWCHVMVERLFLAVPWACLRFVILVFPDHTHLLFYEYLKYTEKSENSTPGLFVIYIKNMQTKNAIESVFKDQILGNA